MVELVMVIVIFSILAGVAIPRFIDLRSNARAGTARGIGAAITSEANLLHMRYMVKGTLYVLGTTGGPSTGVLFNANIGAGATVAAVPNTVTADGRSAKITITVGRSPYTMTYTAGSPTGGPKVRFNNF